MNPVHVCGSAFWIVHHDAIDAVYDLALGFWHKAKETGLAIDVSAALGYAMQILCADPEAHLLETHPNLWCYDEFRGVRELSPEGKPWAWRHPLRYDAIEVRPAIVHVPSGRPSASGDCNGL